MKTKKHVWMLLACGITAVLAVLYIRVAKRGNLYIDGSIVLWALALTAGLFAFAELARFLFMKLCPKLAAGEKAHVRGITFGAREIMAVILCIPLIVLSFWPVISAERDDTVSPYAGTTKLIMDTARNATGTETVGPILQTAAVYQIFECPSVFLHKLELKAATFGEEHDSTLIIDLVDAETALTTYELWTIDASTLSDGDPIVLEITNPEIQAHVKGKDLMFRIYTRDATPETAVSLYCTANNGYVGNTAVGKQFIDGDLLLKVYGNSKPVNYESVRDWMCVYAAAVSCLFALVLLLRWKKTGKTEEA